MSIKYFKPAKSFSLAEIAKHINAELSDNSIANIVVSDITDLISAKKNQISFLSNTSYIPYLKSTEAGAIIVSKKIAIKEKINTPLLIVADPYIAFAEVMQLFYPAKKYNAYKASNAKIHSAAIIGKDCHISEGVFIGDNVKIGDNVYIGPNTVISNDASIGDNCIIHSLVSIKYAFIGNNCILHDGVRIGQDGFGFAPNYNKLHVKIPQVGAVVIEDEVEIGANTCIDRGAINNTIIKKGTKIDNLVQIGHNVQIGENCFLGGQVGISGSTILEDKVAIAGQSGLAPHIKIQEGAQIAPKSGVFRNVSKNTVVMGSPTRSFYEAMRLEAIFNQLLKNSKKNKKEL